MTTIVSPKMKWEIILDKWINDADAKDYESAHNGMKINVSLSREELQELKSLIIRNQ